jgi:hypothetical protein
MSSIQTRLQLDDSHADAVALLGGLDNGQRGGIYTKSEVVDFILDLVAYEATTDLTTRRILEPSCGAGDFLERIVQRLLCSARNFNKPFSDLAPCIRAVDVGTKPLEEAKAKITCILVDHGASPSEICSLLSAWFTQADFLMNPFPCGFTHIVGNPPYIRQEDLPKSLLDLYRRSFATMYDRADIYVAFFERSLGLLNEGGKLGFICSDRWMKNKYGGPLRDLVSSHFHLETHVDLTNCPAFHSEVVAYPAVTIISKTEGTDTAVAYRPEISNKALSALVPALRKESTHKDVSVATDVAIAHEPWLLENLPRLSVIRQLEKRFPSIEAAGCKISIGVATGADSVYIGDASKLDVEDDARLPLATTRDIANGSINWKGKYVLNPFNEDGSLLDLSTHPKLAAYLEIHKERIMARNVAKKNPAKWFRTIDRIYPALTSRPKLLIPDIKGNAHVVYEAGELYPHHNLYYVTSENWDLRALQAVLLSKITQAFIATYSLRMRGDFLRYQAQYLRRLRLPAWREVPEALRSKLTLAGLNGDIFQADSAARELYGLTESEWSTIALP